MKLYILEIKLLKRIKKIFLFIFKNERGVIWLIAQMTIITIHLIPPFPYISNWPIIIKFVSIITLIIALIDLFKAIKTLGGNFSALPDPKAKAFTIYHNSYKRCRHPIYKSIIIISLCLTFYHGSQTLANMIKC